MRCYSVDENIREYHSPAEAHQPGNGPWQQRVKTRLETNGNIKMKATHSKAFTQPCLRSLDFINWDVSQSVQSAHSSSFNYPSNFWLEIENCMTKFCFQFFSQIIIGICTFELFVRYLEKISTCDNCILLQHPAHNGCIYWSRVYHYSPLQIREVHSNPIMMESGGYITCLLLFIMSSVQYTLCTVGWFLPALDASK